MLDFAKEAIENAQPKKTEMTLEELSKRVKIRFKNMPVDWENLKVLVARDIEFERRKGLVTF